MKVACLMILVLLIPRRTTMAIAMITSMPAPIPFTAMTILVIVPVKREESGVRALCSRVNL